MDFRSLFAHEATSSKARRNAKSEMDLISETQEKDSHRRTQGSAPQLRTTAEREAIFSDLRRVLDSTPPPALSGKNGAAPDTSPRRRT